MDEGSKKGKKHEEHPKKTDIKEFMEDANQHLWSVSYADLLMVILAFFVVFDIKPAKTPDAESQKTVLERIMSLIPGNNKSETGGGPGFTSIASDSQGEGGGKKTYLGPLESGGLDLFSISSKIKEKLQITTISFETEVDENSVIVHFKDGIYRPGQYSVTGDEFSGALKAVSEIVQPFQGEITITFIGHADSIPLSAGLREKVGSNMILSSLRAAKAAEYFIGLGIDQQGIVTQGRDSFGRGSRTLSIKITAKAGGEG